MAGILIIWFSAEVDFLKHVMKMTSMCPKRALQCRNTPERRRTRAIFARSLRGEVLIRLCTTWDRYNALTGKLYGIVPDLNTTTQMNKRLICFSKSFLRQRQKYSDIYDGLAKTIETKKEKTSSALSICLVCDAIFIKSAHSYGNFFTRLPFPHTK